MPERSATFRSAVWNHVGKLLEYGTVYVTSVIIARALGVEANGAYAGLISLSQLLLVVCSFGLETSLNKHIPQLGEERTLEKTRFLLRRSLLIRIGLFAGVAVVFLLIFRFFEDVVHESLRGYLWLLLGYASIRSITPLFGMVLTAQLKTALNSAINLLTEGLELIVVIIMMHFGVSLSGLFVLFIATGVIQIACHLIFAGSNIFGGQVKTELAPFLTFGGFYWINTIVDYFLGRRGDVLFLASLLTDLREASLYDVASSFARLASLVTTVGLAGVAFATFARLAVSDLPRMNQFYSFLIRMISIVTIPTFAFLLFNAEAVLSVIYSPSFAPAAVLLQGLAAFRIASRLFGAPENAEYLLSRGRVSPVVWIGVGGVSLNILMNIVLIPIIGAGGAVLGSGAANLLVNGVSAMFVYRMSGERMQLAHWSRLTVISVLASLAVSLLLPSPTMSILLLRVVVFAVIVAGLFTAVKPISTLDLIWLSRIDERLVRKLRMFILRTG